MCAAAASPIAATSVGGYSSPSSPLPCNRERFQSAIAREVVALRRELNMCRDEVLALRDCLTDAGTFAPVKFHMKLHRHRFAAACATHGFRSDVCLETVIGTPGIALTLGLRAGIAAVKAACSASRATRHAGGAILHSVLEWIPGSIYICGGYNDRQRLRTVERFNPASGVWEFMPPMMYRRHGASAGVIRGQPYICGGRDGQHLWNSVERFDPASGVWEAVPSMLVARAYASAGSIGGRLYNCGGSDTGMLGFRSAECYSPQISMWEALPPMSEPRQYPAVGAVGGVLYVCGGSSGLMHTPLNTVELYDPSTGMWQAAPPMIERRRGAMAAAVGGRLYVCGGTHTDVLSSMERLDPGACSWEMLPPMTVGRHCAVVAATAGYLYVFGGSSGSGQFMNSAERYDPKCGRWQAEPPMLERRGNAAAVAAPR